MAIDDNDIDDKLINNKDDTTYGHSRKADEGQRWSEKVAEKYESLRKAVNDNLPDIWNALEFGLAVKTILNIKDCNQPFAGIILGPPSSLKTQTIELFRDLENTFYTHDFTPSAWVTHNSSIKREKLREFDMLPKIKNKLFLTPELAPMFSQREDDLQKQ